MKQINSNPIRKQFGPVPILSIAASIIMATSSVSLLHSQGQALGNIFGKGSVLGGVLYVANEVLRDDVLITTRLSSYNYLFVREYEGAIYESTASISSKINTLDWVVKYDYAREVYAGLDGMLVFSKRDTTSAFAPMIGTGKSSDELEAEALKGGAFPLENFLAVRAFNCKMENADWLMVEESDFAYNITWKYTPNENGESWWRKERDFQLTLSNWKNQQMSCREFYPEPSAYFTTGKAIKRGDKAGGLIEALPYQSLFGLVNISANTQNAGFVFEPINKRP